MILRVRRNFFEITTFPHNDIVQLPDTIGMLWVYQTSQRNWVAIKVHYRYLRKCLLGWRISRLGFVTPIVGEVSLGPLSKYTSL